MPSNRVILYKFLTQDILPLLREGGFWAAPDPAPLTMIEVVKIFEEVALDPSYQRQHLETVTSDEKRVVLQNGVVSVLEPKMN